MYSMKSEIATNFKLTVIDSVDNLDFALPLNILPNQKHINMGSTELNLVHFDIVLTAAVRMISYIDRNS